ncbi:hypothetical protein CSOJ01_07836 [Colletotrichum sojae]|uniref:Uncharacterized protein n=1 Tax=Colletotrichum sojae TaxID=2175907 RepID=A0A8H6J8C0_9PEZI|nr:hypothetical protein CSOJ01_07836 [Colletotrichum sojae]
MFTSGISGLNPSTVQICKGETGLAYQHFTSDNLVEPIGSGMRDVPFRRGARRGHARKDMDMPRPQLSRRGRKTQYPRTLQSSAARAGPLSIDTVAQHGKLMRAQTKDSTLFQEEPCVRVGTLLIENHKPGNSGRRTLIREARQLLDGRLVNTIVDQATTLCMPAAYKPKVGVNMEHDTVITQLANERLSTSLAGCLFPALKRIIICSRHGRFSGKTERQKTIRQGGLRRGDQPEGGSTLKEQRYMRLGHTVRGQRSRICPLALARIHLESPIGLQGYESTGWKRGGGHLNVGIPAGCIRPRRFGGAQSKKVHDSSPATGSDSASAPHYPGFPGMPRTPRSNDNWDIAKRRREDRSASLTLTLSLSLHHPISPHTFTAYRHYAARGEVHR